MFNATDFAAMDNALTQISTASAARIKALVTTAWADENFVLDCPISTAPEYFGEDFHFVVEIDAKSARNGGTPMTHRTAAGYDRDVALRIVVTNGTWTIRRETTWFPSAAISLTEAESLFYTAAGGALEARWAAKAA